MTAVHPKRNRSDAHAALAAIKGRRLRPTIVIIVILSNIVSKIQNPLATEILKGTLGAETGVCVDYRGGEFTFERIAEAVAVS